MLHRIRHLPSRRPAGIVVVLLLVAVAASAQTNSGQVQQGQGGVCCLNNFRYSGTCEVTVGPGESCSDALSYLNNFQSAGRQHCGNTLIRGGWTLVRCASAGSGSHGPSGPIATGVPVTAVGTATMEPIGTNSPTTLSRRNATFITPVEASEFGPAAAPGLIDL